MTINKENHGSTMETGRKRKLLFVEDEIELAQLFASRLGRNGFEVFIVQDGASAISFVEENIPDIVLLDLTLPDMNGDTVCEKIRKHANPQIATLPVIILSGKAKDTVSEICETVGASSYAIKPYDAAALLNEIERLLQSKHT